MEHALRQAAAETVFGAGWNWARIAGSLIGRGHERLWWSAAGPRL